MICSFWLVSCLAQAGEVDRAEALFDAARRLRQRPRPARRGDRHGERRAARQLPAGLQPHRPDHRRVRDRQGAGADGMSGRTSTSSSSAAGRPASTARARWPTAACGSRSSSASWSAASAPTGAASRPRRCCGPARRCSAAREAPGAREAVARDARRRRGVRLARLHGLRLRRRRRSCHGSRSTASSSSAATAASTARVAVCVGDRRLTARHVVRRHRLGAGHPAGARAARARRRVDQPRGHGADRGPPAAARARRRRRRRGARAGPAPPGRRGRGGRGHGPRAPPRAAARSATRSAARSPPRASSCTSASTPRPRGARAATTCSSSPDGTALRGDRLLVATGPPPARRAASAWRRSASRTPPAASRSTRACAPATGLWAIGDVTGHLAADLRRQVPGPHRRGQHPGRAAAGGLRRRPARRLHRPAGRGGRRAPRAR